LHALLTSRAPELLAVALPLTTPYPGLEDPIRLDLLVPELLEDAHLES
jgi:hypothetical protein